MNNSQSRYNKFNTLTNSIKRLKESSGVPSEREKDYVELYNIVNDLYSLRDEVLPQRANNIKKLLEQKRGKIKISSFSLMQHDFVENTHSNILEYIFDYNLIGNIGSKILSDFVLGINSDISSELSQLILKNGYTIQREYAVSNGRMDLFIHDPSNQFAIIIENKIFASISEKDELLNEGESGQVTQLTYYIRHLKKHYKSCKTLYIILSFKSLDNKNYSPFVVVDYGYLYNILSKYKADDNILSEYKTLLYSINNGMHNSIISLTRNFKKLLNNQNNSIDLNSFEQIRTLLDGIK